MGGIWEGSERLGVPRASQGDPSHVSSYKWCHSRTDCKSSLKMQLLLFVFEGNITVDCYLQQLRATGAADALPNPPRALTNTVRTPTAKSCLGNNPSVRPQTIYIEKSAKILIKLDFRASFVFGPGIG